MPEALHYPLDFTFETFALAPRFAVTDARGRQAAFTKQEPLGFRGRVRVWSSATGRRFRHEREAEVGAEAETQIVPSLMVTVLLQRGRG